jgi:hypothetical protein
MIEKLAFILLIGAAVGTPVLFGWFGVKAFITGKSTMVGRTGFGPTFDRRKEPRMFFFSAIINLAFTVLFGGALVYVFFLV